MFEDFDNPLGKMADVIASSWTRMFGSRNERLITEILPIVQSINDLEAKYEKLTDAQLRAKTDEFRKRIHGELAKKKAPPLMKEARNLRMDGRPEEAEVLEKKFKEAYAKGADWLAGKQDKSGAWTMAHPQAGRVPSLGFTGLAVTGLAGGSQAEKHKAVIEKVMPRVPAEARTAFVDTMADSMKKSQS